MSVIPETPNSRLVQITFDFGPGGAGDVKYLYFFGPEGGPFQAFENGLGGVWVQGVPVPEPSSIILAAIAGATGAGWWLVRRR